MYLMIQGVGIDIVEVERIKKALQNKKFKKRIFTSCEIKECEKSKIKYQKFSAKFAAKEAIKKATDIPLIFKDIEIIKDKSGKPQIKFHRKIKKLMRNKKVLLSLSHIEKYAVALAIAY